MEHKGGHTEKLMLLRLQGHCDFFYYHIFCNTLFALFTVVVD